MVSFRVMAAYAALGMLIYPAIATAHGIAGNRCFPGTLSFDDPAVADELAFPGFYRFRHLQEGSEVTHTAIPASFTRLVTRDIAVGADSNWVWHSQSGHPENSGVGMTHLFAKSLLYKNDWHEALMATGLGWGIRGVGSSTLDGHAFNAIEPEISFGKGFGDLPNGLGWLRPFGITGAFVPEFALGRTSTNILRWGLALEFSTFYLTDRFIPGALPKEEPVQQFAPLIEFSFNTPMNRSAGAKNAATMNPGLSYVHRTWQLSAEAIVPLNEQAGRNTRVQLQTLFFLDDLIPSVFGKPLLGR